MCGAAPWAFKCSRLAHFDHHEAVLAEPGLDAVAVRRVYGREIDEPSSACTFGTFALNAASSSARLPGLAVMIAMT